MNKRPRTGRTESYALRRGCCSNHRFCLSLDLRTMKKSLSLRTSMPSASDTVFKAICCVAILCLRPTGNLLIGQWNSLARTCNSHAAPLPVANRSRRHGHSILAPPDLAQSPIAEGRGLCTLRLSPARRQLTSMKRRRSTTRVQGNCHRNLHLQRRLRRLSCHRLLLLLGRTTLAQPAAGVSCLRRHRRRHRLQGLRPRRPLTSTA